MGEAAEQQLPLEPPQVEQEGRQSLPSLVTKRISRTLSSPSSGRAGGSVQGVPMGGRRVPPVPRWRRLLRAGCRWLLSLSGTVLRALRGLWRLLWYLLICYKMCWDGAFQVTEELSAALRLRLESGSEEEQEEEDGGSASALEPGQAGQRRGDPGEAVLERLAALEADVRFLCTELGAEKLLWSSRFLELLREQRGLRQRLQERPWRWDSGDSPELLGEAEDERASGSEGESLAGISWGPAKGQRWTEPPWQSAPCPGSL